MWCRLQPATLLKLTLLHECFPRFLNCINGTKSRNASHIMTMIVNAGTRMNHKSLVGSCLISFQTLKLQKFEFKFLKRLYGSTVYLQDAFTLKECEIEKYIVNKITNSYLFAVGISFMHEFKKKILSVLNAKAKMSIVLTFARLNKIHEIHTGEFKV